MRTITLFASVLLLVIATGCSSDIVSPSPELSASGASAASAAKSGAQLGGMIWADGELFGTVGTPTAFKPEAGPFDVLFTGSFKDGIGAISESKPGDRDYNGGRWEVYRLKDGVTTDYSNADEDADLNLSDFEPAGVYFECPLLPRRGRG